MKTIDELPLGENEKILGFGPPGTGKTYAAGTMPSPIFALCIGPPNEFKTWRGPAFREKHPDQVIYFESVEETLGTRGRFKSADGFDIACDKLDEALAQDAAGTQTFNSIVIDNATVLEEYQMNKAFEIGYSTAQTKADTSLKRYTDQNIMIPFDNDYMAAMSLMKQFINWLFKINKHIFLVAHEYAETYTDRRTKQRVLVGIKPLFYGRQRDEVARAFDNVWHFSRGGGGRNVVYDVDTVGDDKIDCKVRVGGVLSTSIRDINLTETIAKLASAGGNS